MTEINFTEIIWCKDNEIKFQISFKSECIKLLSVGIAVFKPLHVWSSKEATGNEEKKIMHKARLGTALGAQGSGWARRQALGRRRWGIWRRLSARVCAGLAGGRRTLVRALGRAGRWGAGASGRLGRVRQARVRQASGSRRGAGLAGRQARGLAMGCALGALGLFLTQFDSVLFLSRFLDIIREPGS